MKSGGLQLETSQQNRLHTIALPAGRLPLRQLFAGQSTMANFENSCLKTTVLYSSPYGVAS